jgi:small subunit ribosomal protein S6
MPLYEHVFLVRPDVSAQQVDQLVETYKSLIADGGGTVPKTEYWGLRNITYRINKNRKAHYTLMNIAASSAALAEMERQMRLSEDVMRFLTIRVEELEEGPSAMMRREARDERRGPRREGERDRGPRREGERDRGPRRESEGERGPRREGEGDRDRRPRGRPFERAEPGAPKLADVEAAKQAKTETESQAETAPETETEAS